MSHTHSDTHTDSDSHSDSVKIKMIFSNFQLQPVNLYIFITY